MFPIPPLKNHKTPILGQKAVVPDEGLGRVETWGVNHSGEEFIGVRSYMRGYVREWPPEQVKLVRIDYEDGTSSADVAAPPHVEEKAQVRRISRSR